MDPPKHGLLRDSSSNLIRSGFFLRSRRSANLLPRTVVGKRAQPCRLRHRRVEVGRRGYVPRHQKTDLVHILVSLICLARLILSPLSVGQLFTCVPCHDSGCPEIEDDDCRLFHKTQYFYTALSSSSTCFSAFAAATGLCESW